MDASMDACMCIERISRISKTSINNSLVDPVCIFSSHFCTINTNIFDLLQSINLRVIGTTLVAERRGNKRIFLFDTLFFCPLPCRVSVEPFETWRIIRWFEQSSTKGRA